jgi:hypothetical protein
MSTSVNNRISYLVSAIAQLCQQQICTCDRRTQRSKYSIWKIRKITPIGLWQQYINITVTIVDIIHRPVFYLKLNSTLQVCPYLTGNTLGLRYESNRLMLSVGL